MGTQALRIKSAISMFTPATGREHIEEQLDTAIRSVLRKLSDSTGRVINPDEVILSVTVNGIASVVEDE